MAGFGPKPAESVMVARLRAAGCVFAEDEARLLLASGAGPDELSSMLDRRVAGFPLEHILGWAEFHGLRISVRPGVFVPRRRTEFLVDQAAALAVPGDVVLDLCCGSGALGAALGEAVPGVEVHASDLDPAAVACARGNLASHGARVYQGDLFEPLPNQLQGRINILMCNAPYVPTSMIRTMPPEARVHEPQASLDGGPDGLDVQRRVADAAPRWLAPGGHLLIETHEDQARSTAGLLADYGLASRIAVCEQLDATVVIGTRPPLPRTAGTRVRPARINSRRPAWTRKPR